MLAPASAETETCLPLLKFAGAVKDCHTRNPHKAERTFTCSRNVHIRTRNETSTSGSVEGLLSAAEALLQCLDVDKVVVEV